jgi:hypothetical protein
MLHDTRFPTSYDREPLRYTPFQEEIQTILNRELCLDMLASASEYSIALARALEEQVSQEAETAFQQTAPAKYYVSELRSSEGRVTFGENFLDIELSRDDGLFFFQNTRFNIFGSGFTKEDALKDFSEFFIHDYLSYKRTPADDLTEDSRRLLRKYEAVISEFHGR